jgi:diguanylate cyclase (GGDEF)-like protein
MSTPSANGAAAGTSSGRARASSTPHEPRILLVTRNAPAWMRQGGIPVHGGRLLLLASGSVLALGSPFLGLTAGMWRALLAVSAVLLAVGVGARFVPWDRLGASAVLVFPATAVLAVGALGLASGRSQIAYAGILVFAFVYAGLFLPVRVGVLLVPLAWASYCAMVPVVDAVVVVRLAINGAVWLAVMYALAAMAVYQRVVAEQLAAATRTDALTELGNRRGLDGRLARLEADDTVVLCDLDHFKDVNDRDGHAAGDEVLERFAATVLDVLDPDDYAARYGGEEFVLVLHGAGARDAEQVLGSLRSQWLATGASVTFSAGIARTDGSHAPDVVLAAADVALYEAKAAGRDRFRTAPCPGSSGASHAASHGSPPGMVPTPRTGD